MVGKRRVVLVGFVIAVSQVEAQPGAPLDPRSPRDTVVITPPPNAVPIADLTKPVPILAQKIQGSLKIREPPPPGAARDLQKAAREGWKPPALVGWLSQRGVQLNAKGSAAWSPPLASLVGGKVGLSVDKNQAAMEVDSMFGGVALSLGHSQPTVGMTVEIANPFERTSRLVFQVEMKYGDHAKQMKAVGMDAASLPGGRLVQQVMGLVTGSKQQVAAGTKPANALDAALIQLRSIVPAMFDAATDFEEVRFGMGHKVAEEVKQPFGAKIGGTGKVYVQHLQMEAYKRGGGYRQYDTLTIGGELSGKFTDKLIPEAVRKRLPFKVPDAEAGLAFEAEASSDPEGITNPAVAALADKLNRGQLGLGDLIEAARDTMRPAIEPEQFDPVLDALSAGPPREVAGLGGIVGTVDPIGGVQLSIDPELLRSSTSAEAARAMLAAAGRLNAGGGFAVRLDATDVALDSVSLGRVLADAMPTLDGLTRIRGFVMRDDDCLVLGVREPGMPAIETDVATAALRAIWQDGRSPFISIDPDPRDFTRPHRGRIGDLSPGLERSRLVEILFAADYAMKRVNIGDVQTGVDGFRSHFDLLVANPTKTEGINRFWLRPQPSLIADVREARDGAQWAIVFDSRVEVMTERLRKVGDMLRGVGGADPVQEQAARLFTLHYDELAKHVPELAPLPGAFDLTKLALLLRQRAIKHPVLERLAARSIAAVDVPAQFTAVGPKPIGGGIEYAGGALTELRIGRAAFAPLASTDLLAIRDGAQASVHVDPTVPLDAATAAAADAEIQTNLGIEHWSYGRYAEAETALSRAIDLEPESYDVLAYRSLTRLGLSRSADAIADLDRALPHAPGLRGLRGLVLAVAGRPDEARADVDAAERDAAGSDAILAWIVMARVLLFQLPEAEAALGRLEQLAPLDAEMIDQRNLIDLLYKLGPTRARERVDVLRGMPPPISEAISEAGTLVRRFEFDAAREQLDKCAALVAKPEHAAARANWAAERCLLIRAMAYSMEAKVYGQVDPARAEAVMSESQRVADELAALHPMWPTPKLFQKPVSPAEGARRFEALLDRGDGDDPLLADMGVMLGTDQVLAWYGLTIWQSIDMRERFDESPTRLLGRILPRLRAGPARDLFTTIHRLSSARTEDDARDAARAALAQLPERLPADAMAILALTAFYPILLSLENDDGAVAATEKLFACTADLDGLSLELANMVAALRLQAVMMTGGRRPGALDRASDDIRVLFGLVAMSQGGQGLALPPGVDGLVANATTAVRARTVGLVLDVLRLAGEKLQGSPDGAWLGDLERELRAKLPRVETRPPVHDWASWVDPTAAAAGVGGFGLLGIAVAAALALGLGGIVLLVIRARRRRA